MRAIPIEEKIRRYGPGPWIEEDDHAEWTDPVTGMRCLVLRARFPGSLCGYVRVPEGNPLIGKHYRDEVITPPGFKWRAFEKLPPMETLGQVVRHGFGDGRPMRLGLALECHYGATFSGHIALEGYTGWWFGFDCGHHQDLQPGVVKAMRKLGMDELYDSLLNFTLKLVYRDMAYVKKECATLALSIASFNVRETDGETPDRRAHRGHRGRPR